ncbi:MAG: CinA family protein [Candidatus Omnitrophota bacterium]
MHSPQNLIVTLKNKGLTLAAAESCSAGYLSYLVTKIPGSSKVFRGGIIVYSLKAKEKFFKIPYPLLEKTQGVSGNVAKTLALGIRTIFDSDIGVSIVGFAGPQTIKGVKAGTVYIAIAYAGTVKIKKIVIKGSRDTVRKKASLLAIDLLYKKLNICVVR